MPAGPILSVAEVIKHPQVAERQLFKKFVNVPGVEKDVDVARVGFRLRKEQPDVSTPPPVLGRDTDELLREAGYSSNDIFNFRRDGVV